MDFDAFISSARWTFAKTYARFAPHWYCVRQEYADDATFDAAVVFIRQHAKTEYFHGKPFQCYYYNGYKYWTMGDPVPQTRIINRAIVPQSR